MSRRTIPSWRVADAKPFRPQLALVGLALLGVLLLEVWQTATVASLSMQLGRSTHTLQQASAELGWTRSKLDRSSSRAELGPVAGEMGLGPVDPRQIVTLPEEYLEPAAARASGAPGSPLLALAGRALDALVPDASARGRNVN